MPTSDTLLPFTKTETSPAQILPGRLSALDAYRGFVMFLIMAEVLQLGRMAHNFPESTYWAFLAHHQSHVPWMGCVLHDLIQPSFTFLVGVVLPFSIAGRMAKQQSKWRLTGHAISRSLILVFLGVFLRSLNSNQTNFTFEDTLSQIGLGYAFVFFLAWRPMREQWIALMLILAGYWAAFALYPLPAADFDYTKVGVPSNWPEHFEVTRFAAHWNKNSNLAWAFDAWFSNLFPRERPFQFHGGGYSTLSFIPTLGTMILGLIAGGVLKSNRTPWRKVLWFVVAGIICLSLGLMAQWLGICPIVKRIWTPSWVLFSGGLCLLFLASFYAVIDVLQYRRWAFPWIVIGMNSIAAYCMAEYFLRSWIAQNLRIHFGAKVFQYFGKPYEPFVLGAAIMFVIWLILYYMYHHRIFLKI